MDEIIREFLKHGVVGAVALLAFWFAWKKDREMKALYERFFEYQFRTAKRQQELLDDVERTLDVALSREYRD